MLEGFIRNPIAFYFSIQRGFSGPIQTLPLLSFLALEQNHHFVRSEFTAGYATSNRFPTVCTQLIQLYIGDIDEFTRDNFVFPFHHV